MAALDDILQANAKAAGRLPAPSGDFRATRQLCVVTCIDPRLTRFFSEVLGLERGDATIVRLPGPAIAGGSDLVRAVATAVYANDVVEVLVLAHTDCALVRCDAGSLTSAMSRAGVQRGALPTELRTFFGLTASPRQIALDTAAALRSSPLLPDKLLVHSAVIDITSGALEIIERGENVPPVAKVSSRPAAAPSGATLGGSGPLSFGGLPSGLGNVLPSGLGIGERGSPLAASGPMSMPGPSIPTISIGSIALELPRIQVGGSNIDLRPSVQLTPSTAPQPVEIPSQSMSPSQIAPDIAPKPKPAAPRAPPRKPQPAPRAAAAPASARLDLPPALRSNVDKVAAFFRAEMQPTSRQEALGALDASYRGGNSNAELIRVVFKPILESGPKRYRVIDELLAIKEAAATMQRDDCYTLLRQILG